MPSDPPTELQEWLQLGLHYHRAGRLAEAETLYRRVLQADPDQVDAAHLFGVLACQVGHPETAVIAISHALNLAPERADCHNNLGEALRMLGHAGEAEHHYRRALALLPGYADAHNNLGLVLQRQGRAGEAASHYRQALAANPEFPEAHHNLATLFQERHHFEQAAEHYRQALALNPDYVDAHVNLAGVLRNLGLTEPARAHLERALTLAPDHAGARFARCMVELPVCYREPEEVARQRTAYGAALDQLIAWADRPETDVIAAAAAVGGHQPFFLAYQGHNDRALQQRYGALVARLLARRFPEPAPLPGPAAAAGERIRVGFVCAWFSDHSVWKIPLRGWLGQLDRHRFQVFAYATRPQPEDALTAAEHQVDRLVAGPLLLEQWRQEILADAPHVLIYPEIGMDGVTLQLAAQRLAPLQAVGLGHPTTTGLPTIDCFLSSALMEPDDGEQHYSERLVRLPGLSVFYQPPETEALALSRADFGLADDQVVYWCCQSLFKYQPGDDGVFARLAAAVGPRCRLVFVSTEAEAESEASRIFRARLARAFQAQGLDSADHCLILPRLTPARFAAMARLSDVFLDSCGWSGFNSTLESLQHNLPPVTWPGPLARGRHTTAILRQMGLDETIAASQEEYLALAIRLGTDPAWRAQLRHRIALAKPALWHDRTCITALEQLLSAAMAGPGGEAGDEAGGTSRRD